MWKVATNLRLPDDLAQALRDEAARLGQSQQTLVRQAIAEKLGLSSGETPLQVAVRQGLVAAPSPFQNPPPPLRLGGDQTSLDLLDREDRE
ncbi:hypothetical protein GCM10027055_08120 [Janibacter alkaliphilus]|nr:ribbon-helix-helix protein, CopG family [Janibacter alkaliphilus]